MVSQVASVRSPEAGPSASKTVQNPVRAGPLWKRVIVAVLVPPERLANHPTHACPSDGANGSAGTAVPPSPQAVTTRASRRPARSRRQEDPRAWMRPQGPLAGAGAPATPIRMAATGSL